MHLGQRRCVRSRRLILLAPSSDSGSHVFHRVDADGDKYESLLTQAQRLRGRIYLEDGAIGREQLTADGRHVQKPDRTSWHLLSVNENEQVLGCARYRQHENRVAFRTLGIYQSALAKCKTWGQAFKSAVEEELATARERDVSYVEMGGWALSEELRCTMEAVRMVMTTYALARVLGGALGIGTATTRHNSSSILRRLGWKPLFVRGVALPAYYDPNYRCEMEVLRFDSHEPSPQYWNAVEDTCAELPAVSVISPCETRHKSLFPSLCPQLLPAPIPAAVGGILNSGAVTI